MSCWTKRIQFTQAARGGGPPAERLRRPEPLHVDGRDRAEGVVGGIPRDRQEFVLDDAVAALVGGRETDVRHLLADQSAARGGHAAEVDELRPLRPDLRENRVEVLGALRNPVLSHDGIPKGTQDFHAILTTIRAERPQPVYCGGVTTTGGGLIRKRGPDGGPRTA